MKLSNGYGINEVMSMYDVQAQDISTADFDPETTGGDAKAKWLKSGFYVQGDTDGVAYVIPFRDFIENGYTNTGLTPVKILIAANQWYPMALSLLKAEDDATYASTAGNWVVGINN